MTDPNNDMLDDLFAQLRKQEVPVSDDLMARVLGNADDVQAEFAPAAPPRPGLWGRMMEALGGWPALSGLAAATVAGVWIGVAPPSSLEDMTASLLGDEVSVSLFSSDLGFETGAFVDG